MVEFAKYFTLEEFLTSSTARQKSIENLPSWEIVLNLKSLASLLDSLREDWGSGVRVSSGFRCQKLNKTVGGVATSCHQLGFAADIQPSNGKFEEFEHQTNGICQRPRPLRSARHRHLSGGP